MILAVSIENLDFRSWLITAVGMAVVFLALSLLVIVFTNAPRIGRLIKRLPIGGLLGGHGHGHGGHGAHHAPAAQASVARKVHTDTDIPAGDSAVIAAAVYLFLNEIHDDENRVMTIKRVSRNYSPWNSKIYGVNWMNRR